MPSRIQLTAGAVIAIVTYGITDATPAILVALILALAAIVRE